MKKSLPIIFLMAFTIALTYDTLNELEIEPDGKIRIKTNAKVLEHNAFKEPAFFGLIGSYFVGSSL